MKIRDQNYPSPNMEKINPEYKSIHPLHHLQHWLLKGLLQKINLPHHAHLEQIPGFLRADSASAVEAVDVLGHLSLRLCGLVLDYPEAISICLNRNMTLYLVSQPWPQHPTTIMHNKDIVRPQPFKSLPPEPQIILALRRQVDPIFLQSPLLKVFIRPLSILFSKRGNIASQIVIPQLLHFLLSFLKKQSRLFLVSVILHHEATVYFRVQVPIFNPLDEFGIQGFLHVSLTKGCLPHAGCQTFIQLSLIEVHQSNIMALHRPIYLQSFRFI